MQTNWKQLLALGWFAAFVLGGSLLILGQDVLLPLVIAILLWYLIDALADALVRFAPRLLAPRRWMAITLSLCVIAALCYFVIALVSANIAAVYVAAPRYAENLEQLAVRVNALLGTEGPFDAAALMGEIDVVPWLQSFALGIAGAAGDALLVALYVVFLLLERQGFAAKLEAMFPEARARARVAALLGEMKRRIETYIWIKTLMSLLTGLIVYGILLVVGIDYAAFWGLLVFLLNYIPVIGSFIATLFPALLALAQFDGVAPAVVVLLGCGAVQFLIGSVLEPRIAGNRLNISPLVVLFSLAVWGAIWGVAGMLLSVPITVIAVIVFAHFPATRPIAILLSGNAELDIPEPEGYEEEGD